MNTDFKKGDEVIYVGCLDSSLDPITSLLNKKFIISRVTDYVSKYYGRRYIINKCEVYHKELVVDIMSQIKSIEI